MFDRIRNIASSAALRALTPNSIPIAYAEDRDRITYKDSSGNIRELLPNVNDLISATAATLTLTAALHSGRRVVLSRAAGIAVTLPAATGSGAFFRLMVGVTASGGNYAVAVVDATDFMRGVAFQATDNGSGAGLTWPTANTGTLATETDTITLNGTTQGGRIGDEIILEDVATDTWAVRVFAAGSGTEATPFSVAV